MNSILGMNCERRILYTETKVYRDNVFKDGLPGEVIVEVDVIRYATEHTRDFILHGQVHAGEETIHFEKGSIEVITEAQAIRKGIELFDTLKLMVEDDFEECGCNGFIDDGFCKSCNNVLSRIYSDEIPF